MIERAKQGGQASGSELETQTIYKDAHEHIEALQRYERYKRWGIFDPPVIRKPSPPPTPTRTLDKGYTLSRTDAGAAANQTKPPNAWG